jgi:hypothetical protein
MDLTETIRKLLNGKKSKTDIVSQLYKIPKKDVDVEATEFTRIAENKIQFIDTLYLPNDRGFQYALVIVDQGSRKMDMEPMKERKSSDIVTALKKIYRRKILLKPIVIVSDVGAEFHKDFQVAMDNMGINHKFAKAGRHRSVSLVERKNQTIGKIIHRLLLQADLANENGNATSQWVHFVRILVSEINKRVEEKNNEIENVPLLEQEMKFNPEKKIKMFKIGDRVRVALDNPQDIHGKRLHGKFRSSDIRFKPKIREVKEVLIVPLQPIMYLLDGNVGDLEIEPIGYTYNQLQKVSVREREVTTPLVIEDNRYEVDRILDRRKVGRIYEYKVKWKNMPRGEGTSWEKRAELMRDIPQLIKRYDDKHA